MVSCVAVVSFLNIMVQDDSGEPQKKHVVTEVHVRIVETFKDPRAFQEYRQLYPDIFRKETTGSTTFGLTLDSICLWEPQEEPLPPVPFLPVETSIIPEIVVGGYGASMKYTVSEQFVRGVTGKPRQDPPVTKPGFFGGSGSDRVEDSDSSLLFGPQVDVELKHDVTEWDATRWLPSPTSLHVYVRALFGEITLFDESSDLEVYGFGLRLSTPFVLVPEFVLAPYLSVGPSFLRTDLGDAAGLEAAAGVRAELRMLKNLAVTGALEVSAYTGRNVFSWGPAVHLGLNLNW